MKTDKEKENDLGSIYRYCPITDSIDLFRMSFPTDYEINYDLIDGYYYMIEW